MWGVDSLKNGCRGFFNRSVVTATVQALNLAAVAAALYGISQDPDSIYELGLDAFVHGYTAYAMRQCGGDWEAIGASALNLVRLGAIYSGVTSGSTSAPLAALAADTLFHGWNSIHSIIASSGNEEQVQSVASQKCN